MKRSRTVSLMLAVAVGIGGLLHLQRGTVADVASNRPVQASGPAVFAAAARIDQLVARQYEKTGVSAGRLTTDSEFLKRTFLSIVGRIPTYEEARAFLDSQDKDKRSKLIDSLLESPGYVSNFYNFWADLLRAKSRIRGDNGNFYGHWIKDSLAANKPYDKMVQELLTATGRADDNGAAGYYLRDADNPLDTVSTTAQIFLGTHIGCAQCHDSKYDDWTRLDYYKFAALTREVVTRENQYGKELQKLRAEAKKQNLSSEARTVLQQLIRNNSYGVSDRSGKKLQLPKDYQYDNGKPGQAVQAKPLFGSLPSPDMGETPRQQYARWVTDKSNPMFAKVIANRLWKHATGMGIVEPVDDFSDSNRPLNPELLDFLAAEMVRGGFDMKLFLKKVYNSRTYQLAAASEDIVRSEYKMQTGMLQRMRAEQVWDSLVAIAVEDVDTRKSVASAAAGKLGGYQAKVGEYLEAKQPEKVIELAKQIAQERSNRKPGADKGAKPQEKTGKSDGAKQPGKAGDRKPDPDPASRKAARATATMVRDIEELKNFNPEEKRQVAQQLLAADFRDMTPLQKQAMIQKVVAEREAAKAGVAADGKKKAQGARGQGVGLLARASELPSPAPEGHFLSEFGQGDRETVNDHSTEASVTQALNLMNGKVSQLLMLPSGRLVANLRAAPDNKARVDVLYLSILSRYPSQAERSIALQEMAQNGLRGHTNLIWALVNTREFLFSK